MSKSETAVKFFTCTEAVTSIALHIGSGGEDMDGDRPIGSYFCRGDRAVPSVPHGPYDESTDEV